MRLQSNFTKGLFAAVCGIMVSVGFNAGELLNADRLVKSGRTADATVVAQYPHHQIGYQFAVGQTTYHGRDVAQAFSPPRVGENIRINYFVDNPAINSIGDTRNARLSAMVLSIGIGLVLAIGFYWLLMRLPHMLSSSGNQRSL